MKDGGGVAKHKLNVFDAMLQYRSEKTQENQSQAPGAISIFCDIGHFADDFSGVSLLYSRMGVYLALRVW